MEYDKKERFHWRTSVAYLVWTGNLPEEGCCLMINAMLVSLREHALSPSSASCRFAVSYGVPLNIVVA